MKFIGISSLLLLFIVQSCKTGLPGPSARTHTFVLSQVEALQSQAMDLVSRVDKKDEAGIKASFLRARSIYKEIEGITEYYFPTTSKAINGPALIKIEEEDDKLIEPSGFQVLEEHIFPRLDTSAIDELRQQCKTFHSTTVRLRELVRSSTFSDENIFEASRLEVLRIMSLGISGFDSPIAKNSLPEASAALRGLHKIMSYYGMDARMGDLASSFARCDSFLIMNRSFDAFDRLKFISRYLNPLTIEMSAFQKKNGVALNPWTAAVNMEKPTFTETGSINAFYFSPSYNQRSSSEMQELGKVLFFDPILSGNMKRACASCHQPERAFTDGLVSNDAFDKRGRLKRNTPTVINSAFQQNQFLDGRVAYFEDQVNDVVHNEAEMHGSLSGVSEILQQSRDYRERFERAFGDSVVIDARAVSAAIAAYMRGLEGLNSRFDQYLNGKSELSETEIQGFNLFMGKAKCGTCHFFPLFNGSVPPNYKETESEVLGVPVSMVQSPVLDTDYGRHRSFPHPLYMGMFKTPTVRNIALTAPYMHNGSFKTLEEVITFYERGGGNGIGIAVANQTLPTDSLHLTQGERMSLISFMQTLTDTVGLTSRPAVLPKLGHHALDKRKVAGEY